MKIIQRILFRSLLGACLLALMTVSASAAGDVMYGIGFVEASSLRLRSQPSTTSSTLATAPEGDCVVVLGKEGDWYQVSHNLKQGYMHADYLQVSTKENAELGYGTINGSGVNMRSGPGTGYAVAAVAEKDSQCYIIGLNDGWYKVLYQGKTGYIRSDFVTLTELPYENQASPNTPKFFRRGKSTGVAPSAAALDGSAGSSTDSSPSASPAGGQATGSQILAEAQKYLGVRYVYGGASPSGFDCSGLVYYVLKELGYAPYRTPADQFAQGSSVEKEALAPGDLVFFSNTGGRGITHVGIYAGEGRFLHAPNSRSTVSYSDLTSGYWAEHYYGARRMS